MSGHPIYTDEPQVPGRRAFLKRLTAFAAIPFVAAYVQSCANESHKEQIGGSMIASGSAIGHMVRKEGAIPAPSSFITTDILIAGAGISGLSAARWLQANGAQNVMLLEMGNESGGNSVYGKNKVSAYPWAAHYLPLPDKTNKELIDFLQAAGVITGFENGAPVYNEYHLCHDPEERLYIDGYWQEGLIPRFGISKEDERQTGTFMKMVERLRSEKGNDGKYAFAIPVDESSADENYRGLDSISFEQYLTDNGYSSTPLKWYLEYCCKDDYGSGLKDTSAWAGLHYFAARRGVAANAPSSAVLTWPEGNGYLMDALKRQVQVPVQTGMLVHRVYEGDGFVEVDCYNVKEKKTIRIKAGKLLLCTPQHVNKHILGPGSDRGAIYDKVNYAPWVVANVTYSGALQGKGTSLCWDNVIYGRESVGYVYANHQDLVRGIEGVITWYMPLTGKSPVALRKAIYNKTLEDWKQLVLEDLSYAHQGIAAQITNIDVRVWGHGMIQPTVGYIWGAERRKAMEPVNGRIFFAHSDLSGISIFEEAFSQGIRAAKQILATT
jgi:hypothetical protein